MAKPRTEPIRIEETVTTGRSPSDVFAFLDRPANLSRALADRTAVSLESHPSDLRPGTIFAYRLRQWPVDLHWDVVVSEYAPPRGFTEVKARGFFPKWALSHEVRPTSSGTELRVALEYEVPPVSCTPSRTPTSFAKRWPSSSASKPAASPASSHPRPDAPARRQAARCRKTRSRSIRRAAGTRVGPRCSAEIPREPSSCRSRSSKRRRRP